VAVAVAKTQAVLGFLVVLEVAAVAGLQGLALVEILRPPLLLKEIMEAMQLQALVMPMVVVVVELVAQRQTLQLAETVVMVV